MSIQTVQAKKRSGGLVLLVALLVAMGAMYTFRDAKANVTAANFDLLGGCGATVQVGDTCSFTVDIAALTQPSIGDIQVVVNLDDDLGNITNINSTGLPSNAACVVSGAGNDVITCTLDGPIPAAAVGTLTFDAIVKGPGDIAAGQGVCTANDLGSAQGAQPCDNVLAAAAVDAPNFSTVLKDTVDQFQTTALDPIYLTERFVYQVTIFNSDAATGAEDMTFTDTLPSSVDAIGAVATISGGAAASGGAASCSIAGDIVTCTGLDIAANTVAVDNTAPYTASANQIVISIPVQMRGDATFGGSGTLSSTDITNTGTFTCATNGGALSGTLLVCDAGSPTLTQTYVATDNNLTPQRVLLNGDNSAVEDTNSCSISTSNFAGGRVVGNVTSLTDTDFTDWEISPATYTNPVVSGAAGAEQTLTFTPNDDGNYTITFFWNAQNNSAGGAVVEATATCEVTAAEAENDDTEELVHIDPFGDVDYDIIDVENNVIGYFHEVCALNIDVNGLWPTTFDSNGDQRETYNFKITTTSGAANIIGPVVTWEIDCDDDGFSDDSHITWYSTQTGEQTIEVVDDLGTVVLDGLGDEAPFNAPLVKEWNTLLPTVITSSLPASGAAAATATNYDGKIVNLNAVLNPSTGIYEADSATYYENVLGSHVTNTGSTLVTWMIGTTVTFTVDSDCGYVALLDDADYTDALTDYDGDGVLDDSYGEGDYVREISVTSVGQAIAFAVTSYDADMTTVDWDCSFLDVIDLSIQAEYPDSVLGSVVPTNPAEETIHFQLLHKPAAKQVLLAWAGQRIILEHDWRLTPGDYSDLDPAGGYDLDGCPFDVGQYITYIKGSGPGNFLTGLNATLNGSDQAYVHLEYSHIDQIGDVPGYPQNACISRVLFESEDPGQVDIEAFVDGEEVVAYSKVAFVVYYMKFNTVDLSLVTQVSKPTHNGSVHGYGTSTADYSPGNPWDATADDADGAAEWNVSKDILVRGRVSGWFVNENPSGRAADATDPYNVLPANRWIMPIDWPMLAGGPKDPDNGSDAVGTAEDFRPYYNLLFAPNNAQGIALVTPTGESTAVVATVAAISGVTNSATTFGVSTQVGFFAGQTIYIGCGTTSRVISTVNANGTITLTVAWSSTPAAATNICVSTGVPFEGPYSLIDIPGLAATNGGVAGAALSNIAGTTNSATRDTILADRDIDMWDAPMPPAMVSVKIRGAGFIKQVLKEDVYYIGTANTTTQIFPNPFYITNIPDSGFIPAVVAGGGYLWNSWGNDGPAALDGEASSVDDGASGDGIYRFWEPVVIGANSEGVMDSLVSNPASTKAIELGLIRTAYSDLTIARDLVVYSDNHGEFMVTANGDFNLTYDECATNTLGGGKLCAPGDKVGVGTITSTADYPDFRGKHFPVVSNAVTVDWIWGGYKDVTIEAGEDPQISYVVFHAIDRDGFCNVPTGAISLHSVLTAYDTASVVGSSSALGNQIETADFLIDSDEGGIILNTSSGATPISVTKEFASGVSTFSTAVNTTIKEFPNSDLAASETADECQAWIRISNSLLKVTNVLVVAHNDPPEGNVTFDRIVDFSDTATLTLNFRWSLVTWTGADNIGVEAALKGTGLNEGGNDIFDQVTAVYGWDAAAQDWLGYFPAGVGVPGANDLTALKTGQAYWFAIKGPGSVTWTIETNVDQ